MLLFVVFGGRDNASRCPLVLSARPRVFTTDILFEEELLDMLDALVSSNPSIIDWIRIICEGYYYYL